MKKVLVLVLAAIMAIFAAGYSYADETDISEAYALYARANENYIAAASFATYNDIEIGMGEMVIRIQGDIIGAFPSESDMIMEADLVMEMDLGIELEEGQAQEPMQVPIQMYYADGWSYSETSGVKYKQPMDEAEAASFSGISEMFPESAVKDVVVDGNALTFTVDGSAIEGMTSARMNATGAGSEDVEILGTCEFTVVIDEDENIQSITLAPVTMNLSAGDESIECYMSMYTEVNQLGDVTVELPEDLDAYEELE